MNMNFSMLRMIQFRQINGKFSGSTTESLNFHFTNSHERYYHSVVIITEEKNLVGLCNQALTQLPLDNSCE